MIEKYEKERRRPESMSNLREINPIRVNQKTLEIVKQLLKEVKSGEVQQVMIITVNRETVVSAKLSGDLEVAAASFGVRLLSMQLDDLIRRIWND